MLVLQRAAAAMEGPLPCTPRTAITHLPRSVGAGPARQNERAIYAHHPTLGGGVRPHAHSFSVPTPNYHHVL